MKTLEINIPDDVDLENHDLSMILASKLYEQQILSLGQASRVAGLSKRTFMELLGRYGVSFFSNPISDLKSDIENA